jgi:hypothetical protein
MFIARAAGRAAGLVATARAGAVLRGAGGRLFAAGAEGDLAGRAAAAGLVSCANGMSSVYSRRRRDSQTFSIASRSTGSPTRSPLRTTSRAPAPLPEIATRPRSSAGMSPLLAVTTRKHSASAAVAPGSMISARKLSPTADRAAISPRAAAVAAGGAPSKAAARAIASGMRLLFIFRASGRWVG